MNNLPRTPLEAAIDKACGYEPKWRPKFVKLACPSCAKYKHVLSHESWPEGATRIEFGCSVACRVATKNRLKFFGKDGQEIPL